MNLNITINWPDDRSQPPSLCCPACGLAVAAGADGPVDQQTLFVRSILALATRIMTTAEGCPACRSAAASLLVLSAVKDALLRGPNDAQPSLMSNARHAQHGVCPECGRYLSLGARGICMTCWRRPGVKDKYAPRKRGRKPAWAKVDSVQNGRQQSDEPKVVRLRRRMEREAERVRKAEAKIKPLSLTAALLKDFHTQDQDLVTTLALKVAQAFNPFDAADTVGAAWEAIKMAHDRGEREETRLYEEGRKAVRRQMKAESTIGVKYLSCLRDECGVEVVDKAEEIDDWALTAGSEETVDTRGMEHTDARAPR